MKTLAALAVAVSVAVALPGGARAGAILPTLTIDASAVGGDALHLTPTLVSTGGGNFTAHVEESTASFSLVMDLQLHADPVISGSFSLTNLSGSTQTFSVSASLSTAPFGAPTTFSGSFGDATYSDANGDSDVTISSAVFYRALIGATVVAERGSFSNQNASGGPGITGTLSQEAFGPTGGGPGGSSITAAFPGFSLTTGDKVETPFVFSVVPEPGTLALLAGGAVIFLARALRSRSS